MRGMRRVQKGGAGRGDSPRNHPRRGVHAWPLRANPLARRDPRGGLPPEFSPVAVSRARACGHVTSQAIARADGTPWALRRAGHLGVRKIRSPQAKVFSAANTLGWPQMLGIPPYLCNSFLRKIAGPAVGAVRGRPDGLWRAAA